jgi:hypothetical protein
MKYKAIPDSVKQSLGLPDSDDARLLRELNMVRLDVCAATDWLFLQQQVSGPVSAGVQLSVPGDVLGVTLVSDADGRIYYHTSGRMPARTGRRFWAWRRRTPNQQFTRSIIAYGEQGSPVDVTLTAYFWTAPAELISSTLSTTDVEFPGTAPLISGLHGRWLRYQELKVEAAGPYEQQFANDLAALKGRNPRGAEPPPFTIGDVLYSTGDRPH